GMAWADMPGTAKRLYYLRIRKALREIPNPSRSMLARATRTGAKDTLCVEIWKAMWSVLMEEADKLSSLGGARWQDE
ncbi:MAG: hypothetical protein KGL39_58965, partial [Patescibacteria group bacterium]|nr:hypothetical protein [Patescibacteria group bacterium]